MKKIFAGSVILAVVLLFISSCSSDQKAERIKTDSLSISQGHVLFQNNCAGCHNFRQNGIGPVLSGVTKTDSLSWLKRFIRAPKSMIESGDEHAKKLLADFHTLMPSFTALKEEEIDQLIAYLNIHKESKKEIPDPLAIHDPVPEKIKASDIVLNLEPMAQIPASSSKEPLTRISKMDWLATANAWFVLDQRGLLYKLANQKAKTWLDISKWKPYFINQPGLATGFGSFAFHPDYARNGLFYTSHTEPPHSGKADFPIADSISQTLQWVICEWKSANPTDSVFRGTCRELIRIDMVSGIHGVQELIFNPLAKPAEEDYGLLFIGVGDGGAVENGFAFLTDHPQRVWGSILRIEPSGKTSRNSQYGIPNSNPYVKNSDSNVVREIYADGFRNPNRITWLHNKQMLATNIGQANIEAIDLIRKGNHYGWPIREGHFLMRPDEHMNNLYTVPANDSSFHITYPVAVFDHDEGKAIAGGFEYEGKSIPALKGKYLFGDIPTGRLFYVNVADLKQGGLATVKEWFISLNGKQRSLRDICGQDRVDLRFARDDSGEIYIFTKPDGKIYKIR